MLVVAGNLLEAESVVKVEEREKYLADKCPPLELPYSRDELMVSPAVTLTIMNVELLTQKKMQHRKCASVSTSTSTCSTTSAITGISVSTITGVDTSPSECSSISTSITASTSLIFHVSCTAASEPTDD